MPRQKTKFWQSPAFKELKRIWEERLRESGFIDAEKNGDLMQNSSNAYRTKNEVVIEGKRRYYELLGQCCHDETFTDEVDAYVMFQRSQGVPIKDIRAALKSRGERSGHETIRKIIRHYEALWKIKTKKKR